MTYVLGHKIASPGDAQFYETEFSASPFQGLVQQASGQAPSSAATAQQAMLQAAQRGMLQNAGAPQGVNPTLARLLAARAGGGAQMQALAQGAQQRFAEQQTAQQALLEAQIRQRQMQMEQFRAYQQFRNVQRGAQMAQQGSAIAGASGLVSDVAQMVQAANARRSTQGTAQSLAVAAPSAQPSVSQQLQKDAYLQQLRASGY